jgi:hypothetical protein
MSSRQVAPASTARPRHPLGQRRRGVITLEWILLVTVIIIGTVGAVAIVRNALVLEYVEILETICKMSICET